MKQSIWEQGLREHIQKLAGDIGERHLGSTGEQRAIEYMEQVFQAAGFKTAREPVDTLGWRYGGSRLALADGSLDFDAFPCFFSNPCDLRGLLVECHMQEMQALEGMDLTGRLCFLYGEMDGVTGANSIAEALDRRGAAGLIFTSPYDDTVSTKIVRSPNLERLAVMTVSRNVAREIARHRHAEFVMRIEAEKFPWRTYNVTAWAGAAATPAPRCIVGAHYDTPPGVPGAGDNASGTAFILEAARHMKTVAEAHGLQFVAFAGEEFASIGSRTYVEQHREELEKNLRWMAAVDDIGIFMARHGLAITCPEELVQRIETLVNAAGFHCERNRPGASDNVAFQRAGFPGMQFFHYHGPSHQGSGAFPLHSPRDTIAVVDFERLAVQAEAIAAALTRLAEH